MILLPLSDDVADLVESAITEFAFTLTVLCKAPLKVFVEKTTDSYLVSDCTLSAFT